MAKPPTQLALRVVWVPTTLLIKEVVFASTLAKRPKTTFVPKISTMNIALTKKLLREVGIVVSITKVKILMKIMELKIKKFLFPLSRVLAGHCPIGTWTWVSSRFNSLLFFLLFFLPYKILEKRQKRRGREELVTNIWLYYK